MSLKTDDVLRAEAKAIYPEIDIRAGLTGDPLKLALGKLGFGALCLSGGGIRSAAFSFGLIQALANFPGVQSVPRSEAEKKVAASRSLLAQFHFLSTVSGGGYTGAFLSAWRHQSNFADIWANLVARPNSSEKEAGAISWLRAHSNYLTPRLGITSADTWAAIALSLRNLLLNWMVILPAFCTVILLLKLLAVLSDWLTRNLEQSFIPVQAGIGTFGVLLLIASIALITRNRPTRLADEHDGLTQGEFLFGPLLLSVLSALCLMQFLASDLVGLMLLKCVANQETTVVKLWFGELTRCNPGQVVENHLLAANFTKVQHAGFGATAGALLYAVGWLAGWPRRPDLFDFLLWSLSGAVFGALVGIGMYFYIQIPDEGIWIFSSVVLHLVFGVPFILLSRLLAESVFVGLTSYQARSDADREWFGRGMGWFTAGSVVWFLLGFLVFYGVVLKQLPDLMDIETIKSVVPAIGALSGIVTAIVGKSSLLPAKGPGKGPLAAVASVVLAIAATLFASALIIVSSYLLDQLTLGQTLIPDRFEKMEKDEILRRSTVGWLSGALVIFAAITFIASVCININRFSLHALYRNRLVRTFLGAANCNRKENPFTGFDSRDNVRMHALWPSRSSDDWRPFHIINIALNVVSPRDLALQERKAESFVVTPKHAGSSRLGYVESCTYGDRNGISLGTAMAISGAAASPNMGYHSSPAITFLMTMCNVRLGWWLANPGPAGRGRYAKQGPGLALVPLVDEALGLTTDCRKYVYLSDGGHFENLGLYEMVRRRCRYILISDATCDNEYVLESLSSAVRKIAIDLGINIRFYDLEALRRRPPEGPDVGPGHAYHAVGDILYSSVDHQAKDGIVVYVKAGYHGTESAGVRGYALANPEFPHQSTLDQWFSESQFESYRALGQEIMQDVLRRAGDKSSLSQAPTLEGVFDALRQRALEQIAAREKKREPTCIPAGAS